MKQRTSSKVLPSKLFQRWLEEDYPGGKARFQIRLFIRDIAVFVFLPVGSMAALRVFESTQQAPSRSVISRDRAPEAGDRKSQIVRFEGPAPEGSFSSKSRRAPGTLVHVRLQNVVDTFSTAPVHALVTDDSLGKQFYGAVVIGEATAEAGVGRITMTFHHARDPRNPSVAIPLAARALSQDGTFGVEAVKKEGFFARAAIGSSVGAAPELGSNEGADFKSIVARIVAGGLMREFQSEATQANNRAQVFTLHPDTDFLLELTDYFPGKM